MLEAGEMGQKTRRFNDDADILREVCFLAYFHMVDINLTLIWAEKAADALHKYRLAGTVVAHDAVNLSLFKGVGHVFQHFFFPERLADI